MVLLALKSSILRKVLACPRGPKAVSFRLAKFLLEALLTSPFNNGQSQISLHYSSLSPSVKDNKQKAYNKEIHRIKRNEHLLEEIERTSFKVVFEFTKGYKRFSLFV